MSSSVSISIPYGYSVIIGQRLNLNVTLTSSVSRSDNTYIKIINADNKITLLDSSRSDEVPGLFTLFLEISPDINDGDSINFELYISSNVAFPKKPVMYTGRTLKNDSLTLFYDKNTLEVPTQPNYPPSGNDGKSRTRVMAIVRDEKGNPIPKVFVFISSVNPKDIEKVNLYQSDNETKIEIKQNINDEGVFLSTDWYGNLVFYIYAKELQPVSLEFYTRIFGVTNEIPADNALNIVNDKPENPHDYLAAPGIEGYDNGGELTNHGQTSFLIDIPPYPGAQKGDMIKMRINNVSTIYEYPLLQLSELGNYSSFSMPYFAFTVGAVSTFSYVVFRQGRDTLYSRSLTLTYTGESWPEPVYYDKCVVYSSFGVNEPNNIIEEADPKDCEHATSHNTVNCKAISKSHDLDDPALFVQITGTNDITDKTKPPLGSMVDLTLHIKSNPRTVTKTYSKQIPSVAGSDGQTATTTINIARKYVRDCHEFKDCTAGRIEFSYQVRSENTHSQTWVGRIDTASTGEGDC
ncbi:hypothetical protein M5U04_00305 [Xenorhabdus sp. XENO-1]|uniref:hypothetical protein n=1 Tax=Xenorhabdus bovienii TaxID=40576 RepID=UPI0020CA6A95|nr:hypothetical protein [Xenorhabdus bovienii]MCP9266579.1 hypothetical protein [Xenorhabdus bovienii subsp. africana]